MDEQNKNLILATALSFLVIMVWTLFFSPPPPDPQLDQTVAGNSDTSISLSGDVAVAPPVEGTTTGQTAVETGNLIETREDALATSDRVDIVTPRVIGSLSLTGGRIDDLKDEVPGARTQWTIESGDVLTDQSPVTLKWTSPSGLVFRRIISIDENYLFSITQSVENPTGETVKLAPYGIIARHGEPETIGFYILHEGVVRSTDGEIGEIDYNDMPDFATAEGAGVVEKIAVQENDQRLKHLSN